VNDFDPHNFRGYGIADFWASGRRLHRLHRDTQTMLLFTLALLGATAMIVWAIVENI
jgi:hypothetical protein